MDAMTNKELSSWALSLKKLLQHGLVEDTIEVLESVIIDNDNPAENTKDNNNG